MDTEKKKQVSYDQLTALLEFLKEHEDLAKGLTRGRRRRGKFHTVKTWNLCAKKLNAIKDGASKDGKGWSKYWCDWKYRVKRRALELNAAKDGNRPLPEGTLPLSPMEETIMSIIGESAVEGVVIMNDPLSEEGLEDIQNCALDSHDESSILQYFEPETTESCPKMRKRRQTSRTSCSNETKPKVETAGTSVKPSKRSKKQPSTDSSDLERPATSSPAEVKREAPVPTNSNNVESDGDKASEFLSIERENLIQSTSIARSLQLLQCDIRSLTEVLNVIRTDVTNIIRRHRNLNLAHNFSNLL